jgi:hypothetical protein
MIEMNIENGIEGEWDWGKKDESPGLKWVE